MLVSASELAGTIGGGTLEYMAIEAARDWLAGKGEADALALPLGPLIGQCCGGHVSLQFVLADAAYGAQLEAREVAERQACPPVIVFGAGHVGRALAAALAPLPLAARLIDTRRQAIATLDPPLAGEEMAHPEQAIATLPAHSACVILTHSHTLDFIIGEAALLRGDLAYVGMIGSATKRAHFRSWLVQRGHDPRLIDPLVLPIGGSAVRDKRPEVIAALTAAEILARLLANPPDAA
jgi:xanthine dehydrogenase accessory factor